MILTSSYLKTAAGVLSRKALALSAIGAAASLMLVTNAGATALPITAAVNSGKLNIGAGIGAVGVNGNPANGCINWWPAGVPDACNPTSTPGAAMTVSGSSDTTMFTAGAGTIKDLPGGFITPVVDFLTTASPLSAGGAHFDLTQLIIPGPFAVNDCVSGGANTTCSPLGSPFQLTEDNTASQVTISFSVLADGYTGTHASGFTFYKGTFSTQLSGLLPNGQAENIPNILNYISANSTNVISSTWSASFSPIVPEPMTSALMGFGLLGIAYLGRRFRK